MIESINHPEAGMLFSVGTEAYKNHFRLQGICRSVKKKKKIKSRTKEHGVIYGLVDGNSGSCPELGSRSLPHRHTIESINHPEAGMLFSVGTEAYKNHFCLQGICRSVKKKKKIKSRTKGAEHGVIYGLVDGNSGSCPELGSNDLNEGCLNELGLQL